MDEVLIDSAVRKGHEAGICQRLEFGRKVAGFHNNDFEIFGLEVKRGEVNDVVKGTTSGGEDNLSAISNFYDGLAFDSLRCFEKEENFGGGFDRYAPKRVESSADRKRKKELRPRRRYNRLR